MPDTVEIAASRSNQWGDISREHLDVVVPNGAGMKQGRQVFRR